MFKLEFPREIATPRRHTVNTKKDFLKFINSNMPYNNLYTNIYNCDFKPNGNGSLKPDYKTAHIDRIYFDCDAKLTNFDGTIEEQPEDGYEALMKIHNWALKHNYVHFSYLTGNGYNIYIATQPDVHIQYKRECVRNAQDYITKEVNVKTDPRVFGQTERISRIPFTYHHGAKRFCIPLTEDIIYGGNRKIKKFAESINNIKKIKERNHAQFGNKYWKITKFDKIRYKRANVEVPFEIESNIAEVKCAPVCIKSLLNKKNMGYDERRIVITWLRDHGYTEKEVIKILRKALTPNKFKHMMNECSEGQVNYLFKNNKYFFESFYKMRLRGLCPYETEEQCGMH